MEKKDVISKCTNILKCIHKKLHKSLLINFSNLNYEKSQLSADKLCALNILKWLLYGSLGWPTVWSGAVFYNKT